MRGLSDGDKPKRKPNLADAAGHAQEPLIRRHHFGQRRKPPGRG